jgi:hypothetical protein
MVFFSKAGSAYHIDESGTKTIIENTVIEKYKATKCNLLSEKWSVGNLSFNVPPVQGCPKSNGAILNRRW